MKFHQRAAAEYPGARAPLAALCGQKGLTNDDILGDIAHAHPSYRVCAACEALLPPIEASVTPLEENEQPWRPWDATERGSDFNAGYAEERALAEAQ